MIKKILFVISLLFVLIGCSSDNTAGGAEDVNTFTVAGVIQKPDGSNAEGCSVVLLPVDYIPNGSEIDSAELSGIDGKYRITGDKGVNYNLWAVKDSLSFIVLDLSSDSNQVNRIDTIKEVGSIKVTIPDEYTKNSSLSIYIQGTGIYKNVKEEDLIRDNGIVSVVVSGVAPQSYSSLVCYGDITGDTILNDDIIEVSSAQISDDSYFAEWESLSLHAELIGQNITALASDDKGNIFVGTDSAGLFLYKDSTWLKMAVQSISVNGIKDIEIYKDTIYLIVDEGIIKIGGNSGENISSGSPVVNALTPNDLTVLNSGELFVAFSIGIGKYNGTKWSVITTASSTNLSNINSICGSTTGDLYAIDNFGILKFEGEVESGSWEYTFKDDLQAKEVVVADSFNVWMASDKGLLSFNGTSVSVYDPFGVVSVNTVTVGKDETIWSFDSINKEIHGIRNNTSIYTEGNTVLLQNIDKITAISSLNEKTTVFGCQDKGLLKLSYKKTR